MKHVPSWGRDERGARRRRLPRRDLGISAGAGPDPVPVPQAPAAPAYLGAGPRFPCGEGGEETALREGLNSGSSCGDPWMCLLPQPALPAQILALNICLEAACPCASPGTPGCHLCHPRGDFTPWHSLSAPSRPCQPLGAALMCP